MCDSYWKVIKMFQFWNKLWCIGDKNRHYRKLLNNGNEPQLAIPKSGFSPKVGDAYRVGFEGNAQLQVLFRKPYNWFKQLQSSPTEGSKQWEICKIS